MYTEGRKGELGTEVTDVHLFTERWEGLVC